MAAVTRVMGLEFWAGWAGKGGRAAHTLCPPANAINHLCHRHILLTAPAVSWQEDPGIIWSLPLEMGLRSAASSPSCAATGN